MTQVKFSVDERVIGLGVTGVYFVMNDLVNRLRDSAFEALSEAAEADLLHSTQDGLTTDPILKGFRDLHTAIGRSNRHYVSSPEHLLKALLRHGRLPRINLIVDIYNLVSAQTHLALGAHDVSHISGDIRLGITTGTEYFLPLGADGPEPIQPGEYGYLDGQDVICRMEVRQVEKTKVVEQTTACFFIVQGNTKTDAATVWAAANQLIALTKRFCGGTETILYGP